MLRALCRLFGRLLLFKTSFDFLRPPRKTEEGGEADREQRLLRRATPHERNVRRKVRPRCDGRPRIDLRELNRPPRVGLVAIRAFRRSVFVVSPQNATVHAKVTTFDSRRLHLFSRWFDDLVYVRVNVEAEHRLA